MLKLGRKADQTIVIHTASGVVTISVDRTVQVGISAPKECLILRGELQERKDAA